ncbi:MAG: flagellar regulator YcgR PilZN domain-containing protein [Pseudomonas sp.]|uniref:flagellar brake protein n=1 Tax=Pseudomonas sp. TaxID=306 RepID=UPI003398442D
MLVPLHPFGESWTVSNPFIAEDGPQPPKLLKAPVEIFANLRQLQQNHDPLVINFPERNQRFQSYLVEVDRERGLMALDELIPTDGERFLKSGEAFHVEAFHEGVRIAWECEAPVQIGELQGARCYWAPFPAQMLYHQRRNAFRAALKLAQPTKIKLSGDRLTPPIAGQLLDISATGCKLRFQGNLTSRLQAGQVYERLSIELPFGSMTVAVELRHLQYEEKLDLSFAGVRYFRIGGLEQRQVDRFVYQLQREARRDDHD